jgi:hypothetical protein
MVDPLTAQPHDLHSPPPSCASCVNQPRGTEGVPTRARGGRGPYWAAQAVARPSEVDDKRQTTANAETSTHRSESFRRQVVQLTIGEHHIYDI